jgi:peptide-methionine (S)-S-oxide reductase
MLGYSHKQRMPAPDEALPGRPTPMRVPARHFVLGTPLQGEFAPPLSRAMFGLGCFWGAERKFWTVDGVHSTAVGYAAGYTPNPTYQEVCTGLTGHNEVVLVVFDTSRVGYERLLQVFWESHDPTQGMRQGNDVGTQYRSGIYVFEDEQRVAAERSRASFEAALTAASAASPRRSSRPPSSTTPRITTSSTSPRIRAAIAASVAPACAVQSVPRCRPPSRAEARTKKKRPGGRASR